MALNKDTLASDISTLFSDMKSNYKTEGYDGDDEFAKGLAKAFKDFGESGEIITADSGTVSAGDFNGGGTGSLSLNDSDSYSTLLSAVRSMKSDKKDDDYLAGQIKASLEDMYGASDIVSTTVNGTITVASPPPPTIPVVGASGKGDIECDFSSVENGLKTFFNSMKDQTKTDADLANEIASLVYTALKSGKVKTKDEGQIQGASGTGTIS